MSDPDDQTEATRPEPTRPIPPYGAPPGSAAGSRQSSWDASQQPSYGGQYGQAQQPSYGASYAPPGYGTPSASEGSSGARHVVSLLIGLVVPAFALLAFDWGLARWWMNATRLQFDEFPVGPVFAVLLGALLMFGVAAAGRLSWVGPAVAGILYGVIPFLVLAVAPRDATRLSFDVGSELYRYALVNLPFYGFALFPTIGALLIGTAVAAARRR